MSSALSLALLASLLAALMNAAGLFVVQRFQLWARRSYDLFLGFAAGVLLAALGLHLIPEVAESGQAPILLAVLGFAVLAGISLSVRHAPVLSNRPFNITRMLALSAIALHSLVDGFVYSVSFQHVEMVGAINASALVVHELPEAMAAYTLLRQDDVSRNRAFLWAFLATGLTTPLGTLLSIPLRLDETGLSMALGLAAGALSFIVLRHLMPALGRARGAWASFCLGLILSGGILSMSTHP